MPQEPLAALLYVVFSASIEEGDELYHELVLDEGCKYNFALEPEDEDVDLDFYITDSEGTILHQDEDAEAGAAAWFIPDEYGIYRLYVKATSGSTDYTITVEEEEQD